MGMGGAESFLQDLLWAFGQEDIEVEVFTINKFWIKDLKKLNIKAFHIPIIIDIIGDWKGLVKAFFLFPLAIFRYFKIVKSVDSDVILVSGFFEKILVSWLGKFLDKKVVWIEFSPLQSIFEKFFGFPKLFYLSARKLAAKILVPTLSTKKKLIDEVGFEPSQIAVVGCGRKIDLGQVKAKKFPQPTLVCLSRLEPGKGQDILLQAMPRIIKSCPKIKLLIIGEGDFQSKLREIIEDLKLKDSVSMLGRVDEALSYLSGADVVVFPSVWELEGFGLVVTEAMALARPIAAFDRVPTNEIVDNNKNGLLAKVGDKQDLADKITELLDNKRLAQKLAIAGQKKFVANYQIQNVAKKYLKEINAS